MLVKSEMRLKGYGLVLLSAILFGCMPLITQYIYAEGISRESTVLLRNLLALPLLALLNKHQAVGFKIPGKAILSITVIALMGCCITPLLLYGSYQYIATGAATVFHFVYPAIVVIIGLIVLKRKPNKGMILAVLLCVGGICLFYNPNEPLDLTGCALALASGVTYAIYVVLLSEFQNKEISGVKLSFYISAICTVVMLLVCLLSEKLTLPTTWTGWLLCVLLAMVINVGAVVMFQKGTFIIGGENAAILSTSEPITGVLLGVVVLQEKVTFGMGIGSVLVIGACVWIAIFDKTDS